MTDLTPEKPRRVPPPPPIPASEFAPDCSRDYYTSGFSPTDLKFAGVLLTVVAIIVALVALLSFYSRLPSHLSDRDIVIGFSGVFVGIVIDRLTKGRGWFTLSDQYEQE